MRVTQPAVLVGPYDWDEAVIPRSEFEGRIKEAWAALKGEKFAGIIVNGNKMDNGALAFLTNFTPKIEAGYALVSPDGAVRLHSAGSPHMMVNAQRLTWVDAVKPIRDIGKHIAEWAETLGEGPLGLWATPTMPGDLLPRIQAALPSRPIKDVSATLDALMRPKSAVAKRVARDAAAILTKGTAALRQSFENNVSARESVVAAEKAAAAAGASDIRMLASISKGGTPTAIDYPEGGKFDPLLVYMAVRYGGYWADGVLTLSSVPGDTVKNTQAALQAMLATARAGVSVSDLKKAAQERLGGLAVHPAAKRAVTGVGLTLEETEAEPTGVSRLEEGRIYSLRAGAQKGEGDAALFSALVEVKAGGVDILWSSLT